jgi:malonyl-CoA O-methyltransferase
VTWFRRLFQPKPRRITLDADLRKRIRVSFDEAASDEENFPTSIDPRIYHFKLILEHVGELNAGSVLDLGCGKGRFARLVKQRWPDASIVGLDISPAMLSYAPGDILTSAGSMTELPFADESFDAAYATESLEHAVEVERAVAELCRVVKPGGRIAVIDKNAAKWGELKTPEWERWFSRRELERLLQRHCREVTSREISYWEDVAPDGLFLAWLAVK